MTETADVTAVPRQIRGQIHEGALRRPHCVQCVSTYRAYLVSMFTFQGGQGPTGLI